MHQCIQKIFPDVKMSTFEESIYFGFLETELNATNCEIKFRTGNHKLPVETGRWDGTDVSDRKCPLCSINDIGDEYHYLFKCPHFTSERSKYIKPYYYRRPNMLKFGELFRSTNVSLLTKLGKFVEIILKSFNN